MYYILCSIVQYNSIVYCSSYWRHALLLGLRGPAEKGVHCPADCTQSDVSCNADVRLLGLHFYRCTDVLVQIVPTDGMVLSGL